MEPDESEDRSGLPRPRGRVKPRPTARGRRRPGPALVVSLVLHTALVVVVLEALAVPAQLRSWMRGSPSAPELREQVTYVAVAPPPPSGPATPARAGGDGRRGNSEESTPLSAPVAVPSSLPQVPTTGAPTSENFGTGPIIGGGGPRRGVQPAFGDPRVWVAPGQIVGDPKSPEARLDSALVSRIEDYRDSLAAVNGTVPGRRPGDWTIERGGQKWGIDPPPCNAGDVGNNPDRANQAACSQVQFIRLGPIKIPAAVLAALPLNVQGNPIAMEREKRLSMMRAEIIEQAQRSLNEQEFRDAVKSIRERKDRERAREAEERKAREASPVPQEPPVTR